jgi:hypothetical protein
MKEIVTKFQLITLVAKLDNTFNKIKVYLIPDDYNEEAGVSEKAWARIRIPLKRKDADQPPPVDGAPPAEGVPAEDAQKDDADAVFVEADFEDKVTLINPKGEQYRIWVSHQSASRVIRKDIASNLKKLQKDFEDVDLEDFQNKIEEVAVKFENKFMEEVSLPIFDFEQN